ncbi:hypothetical protein ElyMa_004601400 [Elysia marginata]|uniref:Uncharacterized protein n=1 Tax=Elysia marginata TaxID=1093978 RepID=A0AAV4HX86_9GAST|nr:hypothetical protein ElyMa_004601400 [Elysia marginata]
MGRFRTSVVKSWQQRLVQEEFHRRQTQDTTQQNCSSGQQLREQQTQHHQPQQKQLQPLEQQQQQQQQQHPLQQQQQQHPDQQHQYYLDHHDDSTDQPPFPSPVAAHPRYFPSLAPTREATALSNGLGGGKGRILPSQLSRSKSLSVTRSSMDDAQSLPVISSQDVRVSLVRANKDCERNHSISRTNYIEDANDSKKSSVARSSILLEDKHKALHSQCLDGSGKSEPIGDNKMDEPRSHPKLRKAERLKHKTQDDTNSFVPGSDNNIKSHSGNGKSNNSHSYTQEEGISSPDSAHSVIPSLDATPLSQSAISIEDKEGQIGGLSSHTELLLGKVWRNPDEFERKYCPRRDKTILPTSSLKGDSGEHKNEQAKETEDVDIEADFTKGMEGKKRLSRDSDYSQLIIEVTNLRLVSPPSCVASEDARETDAVKLSHSKRSTSFPAHISSHIKSQDLSKEKGDFLGGNKAKTSRALHRCSRFHGSTPRLDFDGACRYHSKGKSRDLSKDVKRDDKTNQTLDSFQRETKLSQQMVDKSECITTLHPTESPGQNCTLELKGTEYKQAFSTRLDVTPDSKNNLYWPRSKGQHISVTSSIDEVSRCNGNEDLTTGTNPSVKTEHDSEKSLSICLQTVPTGKPAERDKRASHVTQKAKISHHHDETIKGNVSNKHKNGLLEDWKNLVDVGECGFIVRALSVAKGERQSTTEPTTSKNTDLLKQSIESVNVDLDASKATVIQPNLNQLSKEPLELEIIGCVTNPINLYTGKEVKKASNLVLATSSTSIDTKSLDTRRDRNERPPPPLQTNNTKTRYRTGDPQRKMIPQVNLDLDALPSPEVPSDYREQDPSFIMMSKKKTEPPLLQVRRPPLFDPFSTPRDIQQASTWRPDLSSTASFNSESDVKTPRVLRTVRSEPIHHFNSRNNSFLSTKRSVESAYRDPDPGDSAAHPSTDSFRIDKVKMKPELQLYAHIRKGLCCGKKAEELFQKQS